MLREPKDPTSRTSLRRLRGAAAGVVLATLLPAGCSSGEGSSSEHQRPDEIVFVGSGSQVHEETGERQTEDGMPYEYTVAGLAELSKTTLALATPEGEKDFNTELSNLFSLEDLGNPFSEDELEKQEYARNVASRLQYMIQALVNLGEVYKEVAPEALDTRSESFAQVVLAQWSKAFDGFNELPGVNSENVVRDNMTRFIYEALCRYAVVHNLNKNLDNPDEPWSAEVTVESIHYASLPNSSLLVTVGLRITGNDSNPPGSNHVITETNITVLNNGQDVGTSATFTPDDATQVP